MKYTGKVVKKMVAKGSKSERETMVLETDSGEFVLRRRSFNLFVDLALEHLQNKVIECDGVIHGNILIIDNHKIVN